MDIPTPDDPYQGPFPQARGHAGTRHREVRRRALGSFSACSSKHHFAYHLFCGVYWFFLVLYKPIG